MKRRLQSAIAVSVFPIALLIVRCASQNATTSIPCGGVADCKAIDVAPVCSNGIYTACHTTFHTCIYRLKDDPGCPCLETDMKSCTLSSGAKGISTCTKASSTTTTWGPCQPWS